ncbi:hypothetical protein IFM89_013659 [Coptis chinensis]|uniref:UBZ4-type domain-containing protein n=1 Tax=Coptis chinensis TaxID=261450 RepID=A0A835M5P8_9MAGN|nr:hypothetical protein IFM89_013659 [Coptis chinensis]
MEAIAIAFEGFSIREYTSNMRTKDVDKCWPFEGNPKELKKQLVEDLLPPITTQKFKWWVNELESAKKVVLDGKSGFEIPEVVLGSEEVDVMNCPVCLSFSASSVNALKVHVDACLAQTSRKERKVVKAKQPKKRSIMEIFKVAPQVESMGISEDEDDEEMRILDIIAKEKWKKKKKCKDVVGIVKKLKNVSKKKSISLQEETVRKFKGSIQLGFVGKLKSSMSRKVASNTKSLGKPNKLRKVQASKLKKQYQEPPKCSVQGILKKQKSVGPSETSFRIGNRQVGEQAKPCLSVNKHVHFLGNDSILGHSSPSVVHLQMQDISEVLSDTMVTSSMKHRLEKGYNVSPATDETIETNGSTNDVVNVMRGAGVQSMNEKEFLEDIDCRIIPPMFGSSNRQCRDRGKGLSDESVRLDWAFQSEEEFHLLSHTDPTSSYGPSYTGIPRAFRTPKATFNPIVDTEVGRYTEKGPDARDLCDISAVPRQRSAAMSFTTNVQSLTSSPQVRQVDRRHPFLSQNASPYLDRRDLHYQPYTQPSPKDLLKQKKVDVYGDDDDFIGLPLNSQGELIKFHSSGQGGLNQLKKQTMMGASSKFPAHNFMGANSSSDCSEINESCNRETTLQSDELIFFPDVNYLMKPHMPSRLGITEFQGTGGAVPWKDSIMGKHQSVHQSGLDLNRMNPSSCACSQYSQTHSQSEKEKITWAENLHHSFLPSKQTTMRLMGKDVTVGRNYNEDSNDGKAWTDKNVVREHYPTMVIENSSPSRSRNYEVEAISKASSAGKSEEPRIQSLGSQGNPTRSSLMQMRGVDPKLGHAYRQWWQNSIPQSCVPLTMDDRSVQMHPLFCPLPSEELRCKTMIMPGTCTYGTESSHFSSQIRMPTSSQYPCQCMCLSSARLLSNQGPACSAAGFQFPFVSQICGECVQPSWTESSSKGLPHWMFNATKEKESPFTSSQYGTCALNHPYSTSRSAISSPCCTSMISQPTYHLPHRQNSFAASLVQRPLLPVPPELRPNSSSNSSYRNGFHLKDKMKLPIFWHRGLDHVKRTRKRPADKIGASVKRSKKPNLEMTVESSTVIDLEKEVNLSESSFCNTGSPELDANTPNGRDVEQSVLENNKQVGLRPSAGDNNTINVEGTERPGPVKLTAGAKHILKPNPHTDQDNSKLLHSTIPFGSMITSAKVSNLQKKTSKIYRF